MLSRSRSAERSEGNLYYIFPLLLPMTRYSTFPKRLPRHPPIGWILTRARALLKIQPIRLYITLIPSCFLDELAMLS